MTTAATTGSLVAAATTILPRSLSGLVPYGGRRHTRPPRLIAPSVDPTVVINGTDVHALAMGALDVAKAAGASYADVRLTRILTQSISRRDFYEGERFGIGVRAFVQGASGFAASPYWNPDEAAQVAREAVTQAKANARGNVSSMPSTAVWTPIPVASGFWATPIKQDPFVVLIEEKMDILESWDTLAHRLRGAYSVSQANFVREERAVATTEGAYFTQTLYQSGGRYELYRDLMHRQQQIGSASAPGLGTTAVGWELFLEANIPDRLPALYDEVLENLRGLSIKPGDIGRYDVVFDATTMASLVDQTIGVAAQVDRALGYEANAGGTSYLGPDPLALLGNYQAASPLVTVTANRSMPRGMATVKWDDEGVEPEDFTLVKDGMLVDYQTTREQAQWLTPWYQKQRKPVRSHGCAAADSALSITMQHRPNLVLEPALQNVSFEDLVSNTKRGLAVIGGQVDVDFQARTGSGGGLIREIVDGKLGAAVTGLEFLFNTTQLWKNIKVLGGVSSVQQFASSETKGEPAQKTSHSVRAVPAVITNVDFIDPRRKA